MDFSGNIERFSGFADLYDKYRPSPPEILAGLLTRLAGVAFPEHVVDLGSGTGLSTRYWQGKASRVTGIEPSADMRRRAEAATTDPNITYREGFSHATGLPDECCQIVTCSQSLHWMEPNGTFAEVQRILVPGGVFAACDCDWPPMTGSWRANQAWTDCMHTVRRLEQELEAENKSPRPLRWLKQQHLERMQQSGRFRYTEEIVLHQIDQGNAHRFVGLALSQGGLMTMLKAGLTEADLGVDALREVTARELGDTPQEWVWSSRVRIGIK